MRLVTGKQVAGMPDSRLTEDDLRHYRALHDRSVGRYPVATTPHLSTQPPYQTRWQAL